MCLVLFAFRFVLCLVVCVWLGSVSLPCMVVLLCLSSPRSFLNCACYTRLFISLIVPSSWPPLSLLFFFFVLSMLFLFFGLQNATTDTTAHGPVCLRWFALLARLKGLFWRARSAERSTYFTSSIWLEYPLVISTRLPIDEPRTTAVLDRTAIYMVEALLYRQYYVLPPEVYILHAAACMLLVWCVLPAEPFAASSKGAATWFCAVPVRAVAHADVVPLCLVGAAHDLADPDPTVLAAKAANVCVGSAFCYSALLPTTMLCAVGKPLKCVEGAFAISAHPIRSMFGASAPGLSKGSAAFPVAHPCFCATTAVRVTPPPFKDSVIASCNRAPPKGTVLGAVPSLVDGDNGT